MTPQDLRPTSRSGRVPGLGIRSIRWTDPSSDARSDCTGLPPDADRVRHTRHSRLSQARYHVSRYHDPAARSQGVQGYHRYDRGEVQRSRYYGYRRCRSKRIHIWPSHCVSYIGAKFVPMRKPKKLPGEVISEEYSLEYGTLSAAIRLVERVGAEVVDCCALCHRIARPKGLSFSLSKAFLTSLPVDKRYKHNLHVRCLISLSFGE
ncbi:unnamed protein product [Musa acuminata subsp. malaccensis]|uniref:adenine phosphoribosyltransferase n=1 Tax=Musa acuminata subsp. malaccensis TaxID=214687 RepID=A0A804IYS7_MUSAM|nr:unnamed protein product [Musa acuminata subsp. malaccensis]